MGDQWDMSGMASAVGQSTEPTKVVPAAPKEAPPPVEGWAQAQSTDYEAIAASAETFWDGNARVYHFDEKDGDVGPEDREFEIELFGHPGDRASNVGIDIENLKSIEVIQESTEKIDRISSFTTAGLHPAMLNNIRLCGWEYPTPIQKYTIPGIQTGHDVISIAQTGSGKTAAYLIPIISKFMGKARALAAPRPHPGNFTPGRDGVTAEPLAVVLAPTRELAVQIFNEARKLCYRSMLRPTVVYGGAPISSQLTNLSMGCDILIGTPGRMADFLRRPESLSFRRVRYMVIDEADTMLADDEEHVREILTGGEQDEGSIHYALFSATFPRAAREISEQFLAADHIHFRVGRAGSTTKNIRQNVVFAERHEKRERLLEVLNIIPGVRTIVFVNSRIEADSLDDYLFNVGLPIVSIHSERTQREREDAMRRFRAGTCPILVATGVTARGIDVKNVQHVVNYDLPSMDYGGIEEYTHRIGRTGRIGHRGLATSFYNERDEPIASILVKTLLETAQEVPDFLEAYKPDMEQPLNFEEDANPANGGGDTEAWGTTDEDNNDGGWDTPAPGTNAPNGGDNWKSAGAQDAW